MLLKKHLPKLPAGSVLPVMVADNFKDFEKLHSALIEIIGDFLNRHLPLRRIILVSSLLKDCKLESPENTKIIKRLIKEQKADGGWIDCEDTAWSLYYLSHINSARKNVERGLLWLENEKYKSKGWGFCKRDQPCIPITAQILYLLPHFHKTVGPARWLENEWKIDLASPIKLNYKAAWYLLTYCSLQNEVKLSKELFSKTINYLLHEQRNNGSWGPWKEHPAPSECFIIGICMAALALSYSISQDNRIINSLLKGISWIKENQLKNGLFPTHYIEEGSAWILFGWCKAVAVIEDKKI